MPTTWAWRLSNLARSSWKAATSRVQVGVKAPMNPNSTTLVLPWNWLNENFSAVVAGSVKSGALSPTWRAAAGAATPTTTSAAIRSAAMTFLRHMGEPPSECRVVIQDAARSALHQRLHEVGGLLAVPFSRPDRPSHQGALAVDDHRDRNPADTVLPSDGHLGIEQGGQAVAVLVHVRLDVLLAAAVEGDEVDEQVVGKAPLQVFEALQLGRAGGAPRGAEAQDGDLPGERGRADGPPGEIEKGEGRRRRALRDEEDRRVLRSAERRDQRQEARKENHGSPHHGNRAGR